MEKLCNLSLVGDVSNVPHIGSWLQQAAAECQAKDIVQPKPVFF